MAKPIRIVRIEGYAFRSPLAEPVKTSFGTMKDRPAAFLRIEDEDGVFGWGEIFANWPSAAAEHRINLLERDIGPLVFEQLVAHPSDLFTSLTERTHIIALQSGEWGPFRQVIAGFDIAIWDLFARRANQTLRRYMNHEAPDHVPAYASGIHIKDADAMIVAARHTGFTSFKVKVGFDMGDDMSRLHKLFKNKILNETIAADANQAWEIKNALIFLKKTASLPLAWLEEPLPADAPENDWAALYAATPHPIAGGENIVGFEEFSRAIAANHLDVVQPDIVKWGGLTGCRTVGQDALSAGLRYCPHFLGGGIGLQASANLLSAVGGNGQLEVDVNPNPLRDSFGPIRAAVSDNRWRCNDDPGLGIIKLPEELASLQTHKIEIDARF